MRWRRCDRRRLGLLLRQPLLVILLGATAFIHIYWGRGNLEDIVEDMWVGLDKEVILSIPLFILCGGVMSRGSIAERLIAVVSSVTKPLPLTRSSPDRKLQSLNQTTLPVPKKGSVCRA